MADPTTTNMGPDDADRRDAARVSHPFRFRLLVLLGLLAMIAAPLSAWVAVGHVRASAAPVVAPADVFMQSVIVRDGELGWKQLCPTLQEQLPMEEVRDQAEGQRIAEAGLGLTLTLDSIGVRARPTGGNTYIYLVTARRADGMVDQKTYTVKTAESGCVEAVE